MSHRRLIDQLEYKDHVITPPNHHYRIKEVINQPQVSYQGQMGPFNMDHFCMDHT